MLNPFIPYSVQRINVEVFVGGVAGGGGGGSENTPTNVHIYMMF